MESQAIQVDERLNEAVALQLAADLSLLDPQQDVLLDFGATRHFEPFGMLLVGSAVNRLRRRAAAAGYSAQVSPNGIDPEGIAAHMGFWQSMGLAIGREINAAPGKRSYLPITRIGIDELYQASGGSDPRAAGIVEQRAQELGGILAEGQATELLEALTYALRELMRNVIEHAMTPAIWVAGMSWPKRNYVQVAVLDEGQGIRRSLASNQQYRPQTDLEAIRLAVQPGVSRNLGRQPTRQQLERWEEEGHQVPATLFANAGYGLYMISSLCREAGQFLIASGNAALGYVGSGGEIESATGHQGTALRLVLQPTEVPAALDRLFSANHVAGRRPMLSASTLKRLGLDTLPGIQGTDKK